MKQWDPNVWWILAVIVARIIAIDAEDKRQMYFAAMRTCQGMAQAWGRLAIECERRYWAVAPYGG